MTTRLRTGAERPVRNRSPRTLWAWVAGSHLVSPDEQAGALPFHDAAVNPRIDWEFSPTKPPTRTLHPSTAKKSGKAQPWITDTDDTTTTGESFYWLDSVERLTRPLMADERLTVAIRASLPILIPASGLTATAAAAWHVEWSAVGVVSVGCVALCAVLLAIAGLSGVRTDAEERSGSVSTGRTRA